MSGPNPTSCHDAHTYPGCQSRQPDSGVVVRKAMRPLTNRCEPRDLRILVGDGRKGQRVGPILNRRIHITIEDDARPIARKIF